MSSTGRAAPAESLGAEKLQKRRARAGIAARSGCRAGRFGRMRSEERPKWNIRTSPDSFRSSWGPTDWPHRVWVVRQHLSLARESDGYIVPDRSPIPQRNLSCVDRLSICRRHSCAWTCSQDDSLPMTGPCPLRTSTPDSPSRSCSNAGPAVSSRVARELRAQFRVDTRRGSDEPQGRSSAPPTTGRSGRSR